MGDVIINGKLYEATDEALAQMQKDGIKYELAPAAAPEKGFWQSAAETVGDSARGGAHGFTMGLADAKFGDDNASLMQRMGLDDYKDVQARSPIASTAGDIGGSLVGVGKLGMAAKGASTAARLGKAALGSGVESFVREAAEQGQGFDMGDAAKAGVSGAALGSALPAVGALVGQLGRSGLVQKAAGGLADVTEQATNTARNKAFGLGASEMKALGQKTGVHGEQLAANTAAELEQLAPSPKWGSTASDKADVLNAKLQQHGQDIGSSLDEAGRAEGLDAFIGPSSGSQGTWANIQQRLANQASSLPKSDPAEQAAFNAANGFAERLADEAAPQTLGALHQRVSNWGKNAYAGKGSISTLNDSAAGNASEMGRDIGRDELGQMIDKYATDTTRDKFNTAMQGYGRTADYAKAAGGRADIEAANSQALGGVAAPVLAAAGGLLSGDFSGALLGGGMAAFSGTRNAARQLAETSRGFDVAANAGRYMTPKIRNSPQALQGLGATLAAQGGRPGVTGPAGMLSPEFIDEEEY